MAIQKEIWVKYIMNRFWKDNQFLANAFNDDEYVLAGKVVHIPQPGSIPTVVKNRSSTPATAVTRTDTEVTYNLDEYTTDPSKISDAEKVELSYSKIDSVWGDHAGGLVETIANDIIIKWLTGIASGTFIPTSGADAAVTTSGQTGTRKAVTLDELRKAQVAMNTKNVPKADRYALFESNMLDQLTQALSQTQYRDFSAEYDAKEGVVGKIYGFKIMERSTVGAATVTTNAINALGASVAATDNIVSFCWQKDCVTRAIGDKKVFSNPDQALYYGDILSALMRAGGRRRRADDYGVIPIVQLAS